jgi:hypothetical protein
MGVWLNAAPELSNIETCLHTVAQTIELGMTGGHGILVDPITLLYFWYIL